MAWGHLDWMHAYVCFWREGGSCSVLTWARSGFGACDFGGNALGSVLKRSRQGAGSDVLWSWAAERLS
jgi:hypothetical protein